VDFRLPIPAVLFPTSNSCRPSIPVSFNNAYVNNYFRGTTVKHRGFQAMPCCKWMWQISRLCHNVVRWPLRLDTAHAFDVDCRQMWKEEWFSVRHYLGRCRDAKHQPIHCTILSAGRFDGIESMSSVRVQLVSNNQRWIPETVFVHNEE